MPSGSNEALSTKSPSLTIRSIKGPLLTSRGAWGPIGTLNPLTVTQTNIPQSVTLPNRSTSCSTKKLPNIIKTALQQELHDKKTFIHTHTDYYTDLDQIFIQVFYSEFGGPISYPE